MAGGAARVVGFEGHRLERGLGRLRAQICCRHHERRRHYAEGKEPVHDRQDPIQHPARTAREIPGYGRGHQPREDREHSAPEGDLQARLTAGTIDLVRVDYHLAARNSFETERASADRHSATSREAGKDNLTAQR